MADVIFAHNGGMSIPLQQVTSVRRHVWVNDPAASYWLRCVPDDGGRRDCTSPLCKECGGGACKYATTIALLIVNRHRDSSA